MSSKRYSLCIPYINYNEEKIDKLVWRIADFDIENNCLVKAIYNNREDDVSLDNYNPKKIKARPSKLTPYRAELRVWEFFEVYGDYIDTKSEKLNVLPIEIVFHQDIDLEKYNDDSAIRAALQSGIKLPEYIGESFFLVVNKTYAHFGVLYCSKKDFTQVSGVFKIQKSCQDMMHTVHNLSLFIIKKDDIFDTSETIIYFNQNEKSPVRYFYKHTVLDFPERKFFVRETEDYAKAFLSKYFKNKSDVFKVSKAEIKKMITMVEDALTNKSELERFFKETEFELSDVENILMDLADEVKQLYLQNDTFSQVVERSLLNDSKVIEKCTEEAKRLWFLEQDTKRETLMQELSARKSELIELKNRHKNLIGEITLKNELLIELEQKEKLLKEQCNAITLKHDKIQKDITTELKCFQEDVVHVAALSAFYSSSSSVNISDSNSIIYTQGAFADDVEVYETENLKDFIDDLQDNLIAKGIKNNFSFDFAQFVVSSIICNKHFVICGGKGEELADSMSLLLQKKYADQIFLPAGFTDIAALVSKITSLDSQVILVHNAMETYSDSIFLTIAKSFKNKIIMFSCEDENIYNNLPKYWSMYASFVSPDVVWGYKKSGDLRASSFDIMSIQYEVSEKNINLYIKLLKPFVSGQLIKNIQLIEIAKILAACQAIYNKKSIINFAILQNIKLLASSSINTFEECINAFDLEEETINVLLRGSEDE